VRSNLVDELKDLITDVELARMIRARLDGVRFTHETVQQTFDRVMRLAARVICQECRGYGHSTSGTTCRACNGKGELKVEPPK
jgi:RecJ-like exonuclease